MAILFIGVLGALIPTAFYVLFVWWLDRYEKEPAWLLATAFVWGALPAAILSVILEFLLNVPITALGGHSMAADLASASIAAPLVEESCKGIALVGMVLLFRREFDDVLDGIIYGAMIGFGFALTEDVVSYYLPILSEAGVSAGLANIFMRSIVFGLNHAFWSGTLGAAVGLARLARKPRQRLLIPAGGWLLAVLLHAIHNTGATLAEQIGCLSLLISVIVDWGGVLLLMIIAALILRKERRWIEQGLAEEVQLGTLSGREVDLMRSSWRRLELRWAARSRGGRAAYRLVGSYFQCATELAFRKQQLSSVGDEGGDLSDIQHLRQRLLALREQVAPWIGG